MYIYICRISDSVCVIFSIGLDVRCIWIQFRELSPKGSKIDTSIPSKYHLGSETPNSNTRSQHTWPTCHFIHPPDLFKPALGITSSYCSWTWIASPRSKVPLASRWNSPAQSHKWCQKKNPHCEKRSWWLWWGLSQYGIGLVGWAGHKKCQFRCHIAL